MSRLSSRESVGEDWSTLGIVGEYWWFTGVVVLFPVRWLLVNSKREEDPKQASLLVTS